jgi:hypothetical protein
VTPVALGSRASGVPVPAGRPVKHACGSAGGIAFPADGNWINMSGGIAQLGPFNLPYRFWLVAAANNIYLDTTSWVRYDVQLIFLQGGVGYVADLNGQTFHQNADSSEASSGWNGQSIQTTFYCEANIDWYVRWLTKNSPGGVQYYQHPVHTNFYAYTVGEGVY